MLRAFSPHWSRRNKEDKKEKTAQTASLWLFDKTTHVILLNAALHVGWYPGYSASIWCLTKSGFWNSDVFAIQDPCLYEL